MLLTLIVSSALAAPTLQHILGIKEAVRDYIHGGSHNHKHGYGRDYGHPHGYGHAGYGLGSGKNENSQIVYIQNGEKQQQQHGYTNGGAEGDDFNDYGPYVGSPVGQYVGMHAQRPQRFGTAQSTANAISSSWSNSGAAGNPGFHYTNGGGGGGATAQSSAAASSSSNAGFF